MTQTINEVGLDSLLLIAQSLKDNVLRLPILPNGAAGAPEIYAEGLARVPNGLVLDQSGHLYVTCYATHNLYRVTPAHETALLAVDPAGRPDERGARSGLGDVVPCEPVALAYMSRKRRRLGTKTGQSINSGRTQGKTFAMAH